jgi:hypothetical protein
LDLCFDLLILSSKHLLSYYQIKISKLKLIQSHLELHNLLCHCHNQFIFKINLLKFLLLILITQSSLFYFLILVSQLLLPYSPYLLAWNFPLSKLKAIDVHLKLLLFCLNLKFLSDAELPSKVLRLKHRQLHSQHLLESLP